MGIDLTLDAEGWRFNVRAAVIMKYEGHLLCASESELGYLYLPGGRVKRGEDSAHAFEREMREELNIDVSVNSPLITTESFYSSRVARYHEFSFYYSIEKPLSLPFVANGICHIHREDGKEIAHRWVCASDASLAQAKVEPVAMHHHFIDLPAQPVHVIINE